MGIRTTSLALCAGLAALGEAQAQKPPQPAPSQGSAAQTDQVRKFEPDFFARYNPVTALDMVRQLPGFAIDNGDNLRGFGATAGNVLIDGQRPSTKATVISDELSRISARDVARIEIIGSAAAGDIDVRGYTELANVVLKSAAKVQTSTNYTGQVIYQGEHLSARLGGTRSWKGQDFGARLQVQGSHAEQRAETHTDFFSGQSTPNGTRDEFGQQYLGELLINGSLNWSAGPRDSFSLNGRIMPRWYNQQSAGTTRSNAGAITQFFADDYTENDIIYFDLGGDWEHRFSPQNSVKLITVNSLVSWRPQEFFQQFPGVGPRSGATINNAENKRGEHVLRGVWTTKPNAEHTVEMGLEGAFNYLDTSRNISNAIGAGLFTPQVLPVASTRVEELRGEAFINDTWRINPQLTLDAGFNFEASRITQTGDANQEREFTYPKPRLLVTWLPNGKDQFTFGIERSVAQLNFSEFASVIQLVQGQLTVGNPDLKPAQTSEISAQWKRPLGQRGSILLRAFYDEIEDVQDFILIRPDPGSAACQTNINGSGCVFTAAGNIGDGERYGARFELTYPLDQFGIKGGMLKYYAAGRESTVTDPVTLVDRPIANDFTFDSNIDFRQDLPDLKIAWGGDYTFPGGENYAFRLNEIQRRDNGHGDLDFFIETTAVRGITIRLNVDNIGDAPNWLDRRFYSPSRITSNTISSREFREQTVGMITSLTVTGSF